MLACMHKLQGRIAGMPRDAANFWAGVLGVRWARLVLPRLPGEGEAPVDERVLVVRARVAPALLHVAALEHEAEAGAHKRVAVLVVPGGWKRRILNFGPA